MIVMRPSQNPSTFRPELRAPRAVLSKAVSKTAFFVAFAFLIVGTPRTFARNVVLEVLITETTLNASPSARPSGHSTEISPGLTSGNLRGVLSPVEARAEIESVQKVRGTDILRIPVQSVRSGQRAFVSIQQAFPHPPTPENKPLQKSAAKQGVTTKVGMSFSAKPTLQRNGNIHLQFQLEATEFEGFIHYGSTENPSQQPVFSTRKLSTAVLMQPEETAVFRISGHKDRQVVEDRVPFLGSIPVLGRIFTRRDEKTLERTLSIFVTARSNGAKTNASPKTGTTSPGKQAS